MTDAKVRVLFVCLGNICRSPMAEGVFARVAGEEKLGEVVDISHDRKPIISREIVAGRSGPLRRRCCLVTRMARPTPI